MYLRICRAQVGILQGAASQHSFLTIIEGNCAKLFPVADELVFDNDFVDRQFPLQEDSSVSITSQSRRTA